jgi:hypothetical protein
VLNLPHFVRFLSSFSARDRWPCYMGCSIFNIRSGLPHALFRRIHLLAVYAPQPISLKRWKKRVQLDQYGSLAALRLLSSRTSLKETTAMCSYLATERQNKQATNMETADNGGFLRHLPLFSKLSIICSYTCHFHMF